MPKAFDLTPRERQKREILKAIRALPNSSAREAIVLRAEAEKVCKVANDCLREKENDRPASAKTTRREIEQTLRKVSALVLALEQLHNPASIALKNWVGDPAKLANDLHSFAAKAARPEMMEMALSLSSRKLGPRGDRMATVIALQCAFSFWAVTGRRPAITVNPVTSAAEGAFIDFLGAVFELYSIDASPEGRAKVAKEGIRQLFGI